MSQLAYSDTENDLIEVQQVRSGSWSAPPVLLSLAAILLGAVWLVLTLMPSLPGDSSPEAGFARDMSTHHAQAVEMALIARDRTEDPTVRVLATDIVLTQQSQIGQMQGWLAVWGLLPTGTEPAMAWMGHEVDGRMPGMATADDITRLADLPPDEADGLFLQLMIRHHQAGVTMAEAALERTDRPETRRLAQAMVAGQQFEIDLMQGMLQRKGLAPVEGALPESGETEAHGHASGFTATLGATLRSTAWLAPIFAGIFAAGWLAFDSLRRREDGTEWSEPAPLPPIVWPTIAAFGLLISGVVHLGLAPDHFAEGTGYGVFFVAAAVAQAVIAAAIIARPSRVAYGAGAALAVTLIIVYVVFRIVPPPGAAMAEEVDLVGLLTKATEMVTLLSCAVLWSHDFLARNSAIEQ